VSLIVGDITMSRKARTPISNSAYYIITRGNQQQKVFFGHEDHERFADTILRYKNKIVCRDRC
jgi:REP element-mobilizing transposase RayT